MYLSLFRAGFVTAGLAVAVTPALLVTESGGLKAQEIDVVEMTTTDIEAGYASGAFTAVELTEAFLERIRLFEGYYNAFISLDPDALETAVALDVRYAVEGPVGPLHGVPVVIKDNIDFGGRVTTAGWDGFSSASICENWKKC